MSLAGHRRASYLALAAAVTLALSACSSSTPSVKAPPSSSSSATSATVTASSPAALLEQLRKSSAAAKSVRVKGTITNNANTAKKVTLTINIAGDRAGKNMQAIVNDGTGAIEILTTGGQTYLKADNAYWTKNGSAAIAKLAAGKYIKVPATSAAAIGGLTVGTLLDQIFAKDMSTASKLSTKVEKANVNGVPAFLMMTKSDGTKIYVTADGKALLLRVEGSKNQPGTVDFTEWDAVAPVGPPPAGQVATIPGL
jgi:phage tail sheath protein FI